MIGVGFFIVDFSFLGCSEIIGILLGGEVRMFFFLFSWGSWRICGLFFFLLGMFLGFEEGFCCFWF